MFNVAVCVCVRVKIKLIFGFDCLSIKDTDESPFENKDTITKQSPHPIKYVYNVTYGEPPHQINNLIETDDGTKCLEGTACN